MFLLAQALITGKCKMQVPRPGVPDGDAVDSAPAAPGEQVGAVGGGGEATR